MSLNIKAARIHLGPSARLPSLVLWGGGSRPSVEQLRGVRGPARGSHLPLPRGAVKPPAPSGGRGQSENHKVRQDCSKAEVPVTPQSGVSLCPACRAQGIHMLPVPYPKRGDPAGRERGAGGGAGGAEHSPGRPWRGRRAGRRRQLGPPLGRPPCPLRGARPSRVSPAAGRSPPGRAPRVARASAHGSPPP